MRILFYSTNSNIFDGENTHLETRPFLNDDWEKLAEEHKEHTFIIATQLPGMFLLDVSKNEIAKKSPLIEYHIIEDDDETKISDFLTSLKPDIAVAASFYTPPFDWLAVKDAVIAEKLREGGIKTICHPVKAALISFDKWETHNFFEKCGVNHAKAVYFNHELFINGGNRREIKSNVYKTAFYNELKKLRYPVIIKDTTGLSSYGMDVVHSFGDAKSIIISKKTSSSRIIEEMILGEQFGLEAVRVIKDGKAVVKILPPFKFSVNKYGITSPKQSVKAGPALHEEKYNLAELYKMISILLEELNLNGSANFDLVFNSESRKWFVLEINPRLSGMTTTYAVSLQKSVPELLFSIADGNFETDKIKPAMNIKFPLLTVEKIEKAISLGFVDFVNQQENLGAKQLREKGYSEMIFSADSFDELKANLETLKEVFKDDMEEIFFNNALALLDSL